MRILVTGSSGQIGTNLALRLIDDGHTVFGVDKRLNTWTDRFPTSAQNLAGHFAPYRGGINEIDYPEVDLVVHLAAHAKVHQLVRQPQRALENVMMTFNVLEYCRALELPVVFSSTREVYGDVHRFEEYGEATADFAYTESPYSASKIASEGFLYAYAKCYGLKYLVFRFSNVYGRYDNDLQRMERVLPLFMHQLSRGEPITVYGGDEKVLDFTYIDDCIDGITRGIERLMSGAVTNETVNLAFGQGNTLVRAADLIGESLGVNPEIAYKPSLRGEVTHYVADIRKAAELLDWQPQTSLDDGIPRAVAWFRDWRAEHPDEDRDIVPERLPGEIEHEFKPAAV
ncbi:MAG TPA: NAD-dependent epimerase/dehydratase family protein [Gaiellaceae bacterium]|jgi:UDP-glucose 4-epimerase|nr:NAD-dependent epimerase/dehydratase family protein [Gaiellaceae bacterium]